MQDSRAIAQAFVEKAKEEGIEPFTPLKLIKLVYLAHAYSLYRFEKPLINNKVEAWPYGPIIPELYYSISSYGRNPVNTVVGFLSPDLTKEGREAIEYVFDSCKNWTAAQLTNHTHIKGSPWDEAIKIAGEGCLIPDSHIFEYCKKAEKVF
ncbi:MAG: DUF4065 domain-containing protein [Alphaproteobacteria bacterium]|nr:DUF4065 domain-containing protein [Alphaproteobacteria bacterium]